MNVAVFVFRTFQPELNRCAEEPERLGSIFTRYVSLQQTLFAILTFVCFFCLFWRRRCGYGNGLLAARAVGITTRWDPSVIRDVISVYGAESVCFCCISSQKSPFKNNFSHGLSGHCATVIFLS